MLEETATDVTVVEVTALPVLVDEDTAALVPPVSAEVVAAGVLVVDDAMGREEVVEEEEETIPALACEPGLQTQRKESNRLTCS